MQRNAIQATPKQKKPKALSPEGRSAPPSIRLRTVPFFSVASYWPFRLLLVGRPAGQGPKGKCQGRRAEAIRGRGERESERAHPIFFFLLLYTYTNVHLPAIVFFCVHFGLLGRSPAWIRKPPLLTPGTNERRLSLPPPLSFFRFPPPKKHLAFPSLSSASLAAFSRMTVCLLLVLLRDVSA